MALESTTPTRKCPTGFGPEGNRLSWGRCGEIFLPRSMSLQTLWRRNKNGNQDFFFFYIYILILKDCPRGWEDEYRWDWVCWPGTIDDPSVVLLGYTSADSASPTSERWGRELRNLCRLVADKLLDYDEGIFAKRRLKKCTIPTSFVISIMNIFPILESNLLSIVIIVILSSLSIKSNLESIQQYKLYRCYGKEKGDKEFFCDHKQVKSWSFFFLLGGAINWHRRLVVKRNKN